MKKIIAILLITLILLAGCSQNAPEKSAGQPVVCNKPYILVGTGCCLDQNNNSICDSDEKTAQPSNIKSATPNTTSATAPNSTAPNSNLTPANTSPNASSASVQSNSCDSQFSDNGNMDIFDSHVHISSSVSTAKMISEMDKAGVSMANLYADPADSLSAISRYPGRFITFVDTPDSQRSNWLTQGQAFVAYADAQLSTGNFSGIGETNLRYYAGRPIVPPPDVYIAPDNPLWLELVDLSARYHVPISFHFVPDDPVANAAFERMLSHNKDATLIWAHIGFNDLPFNLTALNSYLLKYPNLYFDTAGIQNMQNPIPQSNSNWARLANQSTGQSNAEWKQFFETWNSRIMFGSDAGGGMNNKERWLNYAGNEVEGAPPDAVGHWKGLLSNLDYNSARNIFGENAREILLKEQKPPYDYLVSSDGKCYHIFVSSNSSISKFAFDTGSINFTAADSTATAGFANIIIPNALAKNFTALVDGKNVQVKEASNSTDTTLNLEYGGGIKSISISATTP